jgi:hypothetical protein
MLARVSLLAVIVAGLLAGQEPLSVANLVDFIKSAMLLKTSDADVAVVVSKIKLSEEIPSPVMEDLRAAGAGPKTLAALRTLTVQPAPAPQQAPAPRKSVSVSVVPAAPAVTATIAQSAPAAAEQNRIISETRDWALSYTNSLPNFMCLEITNRSIDMHYKPGAEGSWTPQDRLIEKLTFFDHKENYELYQHNETQVAGKTAESLGGSRSTGEWASLLGEIFAPETHTEFHWLEWGTVRGQLTHVYDYKVLQEFSRNTIAHGTVDRITPGFHGKIFIEKGTNVVLRVTVIPEIPADFPIQDVDQTIDYDYQNVGPAKYLLPLQSDLKMRVSGIGALNHIHWSSYRKYSAETNITFDTVPE